jgi:DNA invertase Pin-like site-specific DNA recombinase
MTKSARSGPRRNARARCAIYTRKSSEEGLDQAFNSLQAQREACEAFITSQQHEGWVCLRAGYDDGGFSGATMGRPALQRLLSDITAGRVDIVVVYKIDRLTRSLADFAKIVEILDARSASFVSVTQQFNTTTSMGRLTLNVLLSFAQFEREVIGERIRDKIAASKKKGMWMGGVPPLGYRVEDRKLAIVDSEAEIVRSIFRRYGELGSVRLLKAELEAQGSKSKSWTSAAGRVIGGKPFSRGALYLMLRNRSYRGEIVHKGQSHPGEQTPIIDQPLWDAVQMRLAGNTAERNFGIRTHQPSLLAGMLFDAEGNRMTPSYAVKKGTRYRYYVSRPLITQDQRESATGLRIPAGEIEHLVTSRVRQWLLDPGGIYQSTRLPDPSAQHRLIARAGEIGERWTELPGTRQRAFLTTLIERIDVAADQIDIHLRPTRLAALLDVATPLPSATEDEIQILSIPVRSRRCGRAIRMLIEGTDPFATAKPDARLVKLLIRARQFNATLLDSDGVPFAALAKRQGVSPSYFTRLVRLSYLAPDITEAILDGRQPRDLTADKLLAHSRLPLTWHKQRTVLGFAGAGPNSELGQIANPTSLGTSATTVANRLAGTAVLE